MQPVIQPVKTPIRKYYASNRDRRRPSDKISSPPRISKLLIEVIQTESSVWWSRHVVTTCSGCCRICSETTLVSRIIISRTPQASPQNLVIPESPHCHAVQC